jgi:hypothetical protein
MNPQDGKLHPEKSYIDALTNIAVAYGRQHAFSNAVY